MPTTLTGTQRQKVTSSNGVALERQYLFMPSKSWDSLQRLCEAQKRSASVVIQSLIAIADLGNVKENNGDAIRKE